MITDKQLRRNATIAIAKAYAPELVPVETTHLDPDLGKITYSQRPILTPGMDWRDDTLYMTVKATVKREVTSGRGKAAQKSVKDVATSICLTSRHEEFEFNEANLAARGYAFPSAFTFPRDCGFSPETIEAFVAGKTDPPDPFELFHDVRKVYEENVEFNEERLYDIMTLYLMNTYVFKVFNAVGYIHFNGTANAGKSQNMAILKALAYNPQWQSDMSASSLFRSIGSSAGTVMIDEAEKWDSENLQELLRLLKAGYMEGASVARVERNKDDQFIPIEYPAYSPKVIASINPVDLVLQSRSIIVNMRPAMRVIDKFDFRKPIWQPYRDRLFLWAMHHVNEIYTLANEWEATKRHTDAKGIQNRQWQIAHPFLTLADHIGGKNLYEPVAEWLSTYWAEQVRSAMAIDRKVLLIRCLPRVIANYAADEGDWYRLKDIHGTVIDYIDEDQRDSYRTRSVLSALVPIGLNEKRTHHAGTQVRLTEDAVRQAMRQRRIEPFPEDTAWLAGDTNYSHEAPLAASANIWTLGEEDANTG